MDHPPRAGGPPPSSRSAPARIALQFLPAPNRSPSPDGTTGSTGGIPRRPTGTSRDSAPETPNAADRRPAPASATQPRVESAAKSVPHNLCYP